METNKTGEKYNASVFLNVPFDKEYRPIFEALIFAVYDCGFIARSALESSDALQARILKICQLIEECKYGIHDISRTEVDKKYRLPRFNMPLELGIFLGAKRYGGPKQKKKIALVFDRQPYRYQKYCSDFAGQTVMAHRNQVKEAIRGVRNWLRGSPDTTGVMLPGADSISERYRAFRKELPELCKALKLPLKSCDLHFNDFTALVVAWLKVNPR